MGDLTLISLNNSIVGLRKPIAKAVVHIIHKLSRQAKCLRNKKTNDVESGERHKVQNEKKADRFGKEIRLLQKSKKRDIALFVLQNVDHWLPELPRNLLENDLDDNREATIKNKALAEKENELETALRKRALTRIANHTEVKKTISKFREDYPTWKDQIPLLLPLLGMKQREKDEKAKHKRRQEERKRRKPTHVGANGTKEVGIKNFRPNEENIDLNIADENGTDSEYKEDSSESSGEESCAEHEDDEMQEDVVTSMSNDDQNCTESQSIVSISKNIVKPSQRHTANNDASIQKIDSSDDIIDSCYDKSDTIVERNYSTSNIEKEEGEMVITRLNVNQPGIESFGVGNDDKIQEHCDTKTGQTSVKDSFFLGGISDASSESEGENVPTMDNNYNASRKSAKKNDFFQGGKSEKYPYSSKERREPRQYSTSSFRGRQEGRPNHFNGRGNVTTKFRNNSSFNDSRRNDFHAGSNRDSLVNGPNRRENDIQNIHPSWAAKKKLANSAHINKNFEGKKTKFNEDGIVQKSIPYEQNRPNKSSNAYVNDSKQENVKNIHPSWAAKKEQKGIQQFAGKKTVFGDVD